MLIAPYLGGLRIELTTPLVSRPYVAITAAVMADMPVEVALQSMPPSSEAMFSSSNVYR